MIRYGDEVRARKRNAFSRETAKWLAVHIFTADPLQPGDVLVDLVGQLSRLSLAHPLTAHLSGKFSLGFIGSGILILQIVYWYGLQTL